jgi:hypothetical protein
MRRIKMLEFVLRMERCGRIITVSDLEPDVDILAQNNSPKLLHNQVPHPNSRQFKLMGPQLVPKMILGVTKRRAAVAPLEAKVGCFVCFTDSQLRVFVDSPLPESRLSNGGLILGAGGEFLSSVAPRNRLTKVSASTIAGLGKAPLGRDPKSRARSRDYLKQCVWPPAWRCTFSLSSSCPDAFKRFHT